MSACWRNLQEMLTPIPPSLWLNTPCHPGYQGFVSMKGVVMSQGLHYDIITEPFSRPTKRDSVSFGTQTSLLMRSLGREKEYTPKKTNVGDGEPDPTRRSWIFYRILSQNLSLSILVMIDDKAWGKNKPHFQCCFWLVQREIALLTLRGPPSCLSSGSLDFLGRRVLRKEGVLQGYSGPSFWLGPLLTSCVNSIRRKALLLAGNLNVLPQCVSFRLAFAWGLESRHFMGVVNASIIPQSGLCPSGV